MSNTIEYYKGSLVTELENLEKENLRISEQNLKYKYLAQIGLSSEKILEDVMNSLVIVNAHCMSLKSSEKNDPFLEKHIKNLESTMDQIIKNISKNLDRIHNFSNNSFKNTVFEK